VRLDDTIPAEELEAESMADPEYRAEYERTRLANEVAIRVLVYRTERGLSQTAFARLAGMRQPNVARLEAADHEPSLGTLRRLSTVLGEHFTVDVTPDGAHLQSAA
jgi:ribosome-binding protein aMBF1 (putative translation factor)